LENNAMAFIPVPNCCMWELRFTLDNQQIENTLYATRDGGWDASSARNVGEALFNWWVEFMAPSLSDSLSLNSVHATDLSAADGFSTDFVPVASETGVVGGACLPNNCAICISFRTVARGRTGRGRNYIAGIPDTHVTLNTLDAADGLAYVAAYSNVDDVIADFDGTWCVVSRHLDGLPRDIGITRKITTVILTDLTIDSQRRRLPGRGT
jgi:hypothetical protein